MQHEILTFMARNKDKAYSAKQIAASTSLWNRSNNNKIRSLLDKLASAG